MVLPDAGVFRYDVAGAFLVAMSACGSRIIGPTSPRPDIHLPPSHLAIGLVLGDDVEDGFRLASSGALEGMEVRGWRNTLQAGFANGFGPYVKGSAGGPSDLVLAINTAELTFLSAEEAEKALVARMWHPRAGGGASAHIVLVHGTPTAGPTGTPRRSKAHAQVRYNVELMDAKGTVVRSSFGVVVSSEGTSGTSPSPSDLVRQAVEKMYERLAADLLPTTEIILI